MPFLNPSTLDLHPKLDRIPPILATSRALADAGTGVHILKARDEIDAEFKAQVADVELHGINEALKVLKGTNLIVDGRNRRDWAVAANITKVKVEYVSEQKADELIEASLIGRRNYTKGMTAYSAVCLHPEIVDQEAGQRNDLGTSALSAEVLSERFGVSLRLIGDAVFCYKSITKFTKSRKAADKKKASGLEAQIFVGIGLGKIKQQITGTDDEPLIAPPTDPIQAAQDFVKPITDYLHAKLSNEAAREEMFKHLALLPETTSDPGETSLRTYEAALQIHLQAVQEFKAKLLAKKS